MGYDGGYTILKTYLRTLRPPTSARLTVRFETPPESRLNVIGAIAAVTGTPPDNYKASMPLFGYWGFPASCTSVLPPVCT